MAPQLGNSVFAAAEERMGGGDMGLDTTGGSDLHKFSVGFSS